MLTNFYLIHIQYQGFRYHGWLKQPGVKTVEGMVEKTIEFVLGHREFKILGASRTDAMVSASHSAFELFTNSSLDTGSFLEAFNRNLPNDIRALKLEKVDKEFNIIQSPRIKEYHYLFAFGEKHHPFCAPFMGLFHEELDIEQMEQGALLFQGTHDFRQYCTRPGPGTRFQRRIIESRIEPNTLFTASFFPAKTYLYRVSSRGFMRNQVRLMMGQLLGLGRGELDLETIKRSLKGEDLCPLRGIAPPSGLSLNKIDFQTDKESL